MHVRARMRSSNQKAVKYLLENNYENIWLKSHTRRKDTTYQKDHNTKDLDLYGLLDGLCSKNRQIYGLQIKTNKWPPEKEFIEFQEKQINIPILLINVYQKGKRWYVAHKELNSC